MSNFRASYLGVPIGVGTRLLAEFLGSRWPNPKREFLSFLLMLFAILFLLHCQPPARKVSNGPITFTTQIENSTHPAFRCSGDPAYNQGISLVSAGPSKCEEVGKYPGIAQDTGEAMVFLHNGEFFLSVEDLEIPGRGFNWKFERKYRSGITFNGPLGHNWEFNYNRRLFVSPNGDVLRMDGYTRVDQYTLTSDGTYSAPSGFYTKLVKNQDDTFTERDRAGTTVHYRQPDSHGIARMTSLSDRNENTMRFVYNRHNQLTQVMDTLGRQIDYRYNAEGRLIEVEDFSGRKIRFDYTRDGDLVTVTSPAVTGTPNDNDFPQGKTRRYRYSSGYAVQQLNHNLVEIIAPNEVESAGPPRVRIAYDPDEALPHVDRVLRLTKGGVNTSGIPAGGTISYAYRELETATPGDFNASFFQTVVTDRNGNRTEYQVNQLGNIVRIREFTNRDIRQDDPEFFETRYEYNKDGERLRQINPEGNSIEYVYDEGNPDRFQQGNLVAEIRKSDPERGGDQAVIKTTYTYEPIYNQVRTKTKARGNDPKYIPQNGGANSPERYTTAYVFDYQEGENYSTLAKRLGVPEKEVEELIGKAKISLGLGDVNGDGRTDHIAGNVVRVAYPTVSLLPDSNLARIEGGTRQPIGEVYVYNDFGQMLRLIDPEGNIDVYEYYAENDPDGDGKDLTLRTSDRPFGYLREEIRDADANPARNSRHNPELTRIRKRYFYDRVGNVIKETDGRGIATKYVVNQLNQAVQIVRAADVTEAVRNSEEPNWTGCSDSDLVECQAGMVAYRYLTNFSYDFNDNVIRREEENRNSNNPELAGMFVEYTSIYDILDNRIEDTQEASENPREVITTQYRYDRNEKRVLTIRPVAVVGERPSNVISYVYDERDLLFTSTRGGLTDQFRQLEAHADIRERKIPSSRDISIFGRVYDLNGNLQQSIDGADNNDDGRPETTTTLYDGFDRPISVIDAVGNQSFTEYDPASNVVRVSKFGPVGGTSPGNNRAAVFTQPLTVRSFRQPLLSQVEYKYDELGRRFERVDLLFHYRKTGVQYVRAPILRDGPLGAPNDGRVVTRYEYDRLNRRTFRVEDDLDTFQTRYDGVDRVVERIDPEANRVQYTYDDNNNTVKTIEFEVTQRDDVQAGKVPDLLETFARIDVYDSLDRLIRTTDNIGQTIRYHYDSRDNRILTTDAQHSSEPDDLIPDPLGLFAAGGQDPRGASRINKLGNTRESFYDGIDRKIGEIHRLRVGGQGKNEIDASNSANPDGLIVIDYQYDRNSRLVARADDGSTPGDQNTSIGVIEPTDPLGNVTRYVYDDLDRLKQEIFDDGTIHDYRYDADDNRVGYLDGNGSNISNRYDGINRLVRRDITRATSTTAHPVEGFKDPNVNWQVVGTTLQEFEHDGLSRLTRAFDNNEPKETNDDATVTYAYDSLSRVLEEVQDGEAVSSRWDGDSNRIGLVYPNGRELETAFDQLDRIDRISDQQPIVDYDYIGPGRVLERTYANGVRLTYLDDAREKDIGYDGLKRTILHRHLRSDNSQVGSFAYAYDRADNKRFEIKQHDNDQKENYTYDSLYRLSRFTGPEDLEDTWRLDGVGNWASRQDASNQTNNLNEYSAFAGAQQLYDDNGNLIDDGTFRYEFDFANRLRRIIRKVDNAVIAVYHYDAHHRRNERIVTDTKGLDDQVRYLYDRWRVIEERRASSTQQYVYGMQLDEPLTLNTGENDDGTFDQFFYHRDGKAYVTALTNVEGEVVERVTYDGYGRPSVSSDGGLRASGASGGNPYLFSGRRYDPETEFYYYRARYYDPDRGRYLQRDPLGMWLDEVNLGNGYTYVANDPVNKKDPFGLVVIISNCPKTGGTGGGDDKLSELAFYSGPDAPDLAIDPDTFIFYITWEVWNPGWVTAGSHTDQINIFEEPTAGPKTLVSDYYPEDYFQGPLAKLGRYEEEDVVIFEPTEGYYCAYVVLDVYGEVYELDENNNDLWDCFEVRKRYGVSPFFGSRTLGFAR